MKILNKLIVVFFISFLSIAGCDSDDDGKELAELITNPNFGQIVDSGNDTEPGEPDIEEVNITKFGDMLEVEVIFDAGSFDPNDTEVRVSLDTDENHFTGFLIRDEEDVEVGAEFQIRFRPDIQGDDAILVQFVGDQNLEDIDIIAIAFVTKQVFANSVLVEFPIELIDDEDCIFDFVANTSIALSANSRSDRTDYAPDLGVAAQTVR